MYDLILDNVSVYYDNVCALNNINLKVRQKDFLGIIGPNGGGKTTLLKVLLGLIKPSRGQVIIKEDVSIGYVPQFTVFDKHFPINVMDIVLMGRIKKPVKLFHRYSKEDICIAENLMSKLGINKLKDRQISQLSGGQIQKVLIARALAVQPKVLILDEPTASLDSESTTEIYELLKKINEDVTIIMVSHDLGVISSYVKNIACLNKELFYHGDSELKNKSIEKAYGCPVDLIAHGFPHRVLRDHKEDSHD